MIRIESIGTGYVGAGHRRLAFAERGNEVLCVDSNPSIVERLTRGK
jgi:UDP-glucose 6-dehydrogenase